MHQPIGRAEDLDRITHALLGGTSILLVGDAGVGKSHLAAAVTDALGASGWSHEWIHGAASTRTVRFGAIQHLIGVAPHPSPDASAAAAEQRLRQFVDAVLVVDDIDQLDDASSALIHRVASTGVSVLATARTEAASEPSVLALWKDQVMERIEVDALDPRHTAALAEAFLGGPLAARDVDRIAALTLGNPLFTRELLADARTVGNVVEADGVWSFAAPPSPRGRISDLLAGRFERLAPDDREALELVALGEPLPIATLEQVTTTTQLELLEHAGLIAVTSLGGVDVARSAHPLIGEVVRGSSSELGRRRRTRALAEAIFATEHARPSDIVRAVDWVIDADETPPPDAAFAAAAAALGSFDGDAAVRFVEASGDDSSPALVMLGRGHLLRQAAPDAIESLKRAVNVAADDDERSSASIALAEVMFFALGDVSGAQQVLADALAHVTEPNARAAIAGVVMLGAALGGDFQPSLDLGRALLAEHTLDDRSRLSLLRMTTLAQTVTGDVDGLDADLETGLGLARTVIETDPVTHGLLQVTRWIAAVDRVGLDRSAELIRTDIAQPGHPQGLECLPASTLAITDLFRGDGEAASQRCAQALADPSGEVVGMGSLLQALSAWSYAWSGDHDMAMAMHDASLGHPRNGARERAYLGIARATVLAHGGDLDAAIEECQSGAAESRGLRLWAIWLLHSAVRFGRADAVRATLDAESNFFDTALTGVMIEHARALDDADPVRLVKVAGQFGDQGARLLAAEALAHAAGLTDDTERSALLAQRAWAHFDRCTRMVSIAMDAIERPLTDREEETARLAATGITSREISDRLFVSQRTVDNHLHHVYRKLGIGHRSDLAPIFQVE